MEEKTKNILDQLSKKKEYDIKASQGIKNQRSKAESALIGICIVSFGMGLQNGAFLGLFYIGLILSLVDIPRILGQDKSALSKLLQSNTLYYTAGGVGASMFFNSLGYPFPQAEFGLLADILVSLGDLIL